MMSRRDSARASDLARGAAAGLVGTAAMTAALAAAKVFGGLPGETPPRKVARRAKEAAGLADDLPGPAFELAWVTEHFAYGAVAGAAYPVARKALPRSPVLSGATFGLAVWATSYAGWLPLTGLHPGPWRDSNRRQATMIAAHIVYGVTTALALNWMKPDRLSADGRGRRPGGRFRTGSQRSRAAGVFSHS